MRRVFAGAALTAFACAAPASAATIYPLDANKFVSSDGWISAANECTIAGIIPNVGCTVTNEHAAENNPSGVGDVSGSIATRYRPLVSALTLFEGAGTWRSPSFQVNAGPGGILRAGTFSFDHKLDQIALLANSTAVNVAVRLVDEATPEAPLVLFEGTLNPGDTTPAASSSSGDWESAPTVAIPDDAPDTPSFLQAGHTYHLDIETNVSSLIKVVNGEASAYYDNVRLLIDDGTDSGTSAPDAITTAATSVDNDEATFNSMINPKGSPTDYRYDYGTSTAYGASIPAAFRRLGDDTRLRADQPERVTGLQRCTTYNYRVLAQNEFGQRDGGNVIFNTWCFPSAATLDAAPVGATSATLNSSINPSGPLTTYYYEYGLASGGALTRTAMRTAGDGYQTKLPNSEPVGSLTPATDYRYRVVASNQEGTVEGTFVGFRTAVASGPGPAGSSGSSGAPGKPGKDATGNNLSNVVLLDGDDRALMRFKGTTVKVGTAGRRRGVMRMRIFCSSRTGRNCTGTVKLRTVGLINPSTTGKRKAKRRVTIMTEEYQLQQGKIGWIIATLTPEKLNLMEKVKSVLVTASVTVTDADGNRQTIRRNVRLKAVRSS